MGSMCGAEGPYGVSMGLRGSLWGFYGAEGVPMGSMCGAEGPNGVSMGLRGPPGSMCGGGGGRSAWAPEPPEVPSAPHRKSLPLTLVDADVMAAGPGVVPPPPLPPSARRRRRSASASMVAAARGALPAPPGGGRAHFRSSLFRFRYLPLSFSLSYALNLTTSGRLALLPAYRSHFLWALRDARRAPP